MSPSFVLGVDFGTSHTVAVLCPAGGAAVPLLFDGSPLLPSAVYAEESGQLLVGRDATHSARLRPERFEPHPKRRVDDGTVLLGDAEVDVIRLFAAVLGRVRGEAERVAGGPAVRTVVTHPAVWGPARRLVLADACRLAGLGEVAFVPEPVAAARYFASQLGVNVAAGSAVVVYDFGGGTFDASVVAATGAGFEVLAVDGCDDLGGVDIDHGLVEHIGWRFAGDDRWTALMNPADATGRRHHRMFLDDVRAAKERLSRQNRVDLLVPVAEVDTHLTRDELETITKPLLGKAVRVTEAVMRSAAVPRERIAGVFLVGGASRMPLVATTLHRGTGIAPTVLDQPELVVATGAVIDGASVPVPTVSPAPLLTSPPVPAKPRYADALKRLHWVQFALLATQSIAMLAMLLLLSGAPVYAWVAGGVLIPAAMILAVMTAVNAVTHGRNPRQSPRSATITQAGVLGVTVIEVGFMVGSGAPYVPVVRADLCAVLIIAALILRMARLNGSEPLLPQWRGESALRKTLGIQLPLLLVIVAIAMWWWASALRDIDLSTSATNIGAIIDLFLAGWFGLAALIMLVMVALNASARRPIGMAGRNVLLGFHMIWLAMAALAALPWLYSPANRLMPTYIEIVAMTDWAPGQGPADVFNDLGVWLMVASAVPAILVISQLARMPINATDRTGATRW